MTRPTPPTSTRSFRSRTASKSLVTALGVYPFEEPGIGPNKFNFDDNVLYEIHVATGDDVAAGRPTVSYQFRFNTKFKNTKTILQSYLGVITGRRRCRAEPDAVLHGHEGRPSHRAADARSAEGVVPPNNQGNATPFYNRNDNGENPAQGRRRHVRTSSIATRSSRSPTSIAATSPSPASATTGSTQTSRRSSTCSSCATPARIRRAGSTCT